MQEMQQAVEKVKSLEKEMGSIVEQLEKEYNFTIGDKLVDSKGFPRNDIDVYNISKLLKRYREKQEEWRTRRKAVEEDLLRHFEK